MIHTEYMQLAIRLAERGLYSTDPNPRVGCVIVNQDKIVGSGWHQRYGEAHAEVLALAEAKEKSVGATAYVTLEPCNHTGKTPPCSDALIAAGIAEVYVAMLDPNPLVAGKGMEKLKSNGINVYCGLLEAQARALNPGFIKRMENGLPFVRVKLAMSLDGRTAMASGESQWITGEAARHDVQKLRARASAVLTGINTVLSDDPSLNVRLTAEQLGISGKVNQPLRVVLDSQLRMPKTAKLFDLAGDILIYTSSEKKPDLPCDVVHVDSRTDKVDLQAVLKDLANREVNELHVEAGSTLCGALLSHKLVDEIVIYMAAHIMGDQAKGLFALPEITQMKDKMNLAFNDVRKVGQDMRFTLCPIYS